MESLTNAIYEKTKTIKEYYLSSEELKVDLAKLGTTQYLVQRKNSKKFAPFTVQVSGACGHLKGGHQMGCCHSGHGRVSSHFSVDFKKSGPSARLLSADVCHLRSGQQTILSACSCCNSRLVSLICMPLSMAPPSFHSADTLSFAGH